MVESLLKVLSRDLLYQCNFNSHIFMKKLNIAGIFHFKLTSHVMNDVTYVMSYVIRLMLRHA
jgi:hypothetical protein